MKRPEVHYARSDDLSIAYVTIGDGPLDILLTPGFVTNLDDAFDLPFFAHMYSRLASFARLTTFDKRGTGLSDRTLGAGTPEERMDDLRVVMDAAGLEAPVLVGLSEGGPLALLYATTYPDRVSALALWGTYARVARGEDYPAGREPDEMAAAIDPVVDAWGTGAVLSAFINHYPTDEVSQAALARYERHACSPGMADSILRHNIEIDVRAALPAVSVPTLVVHRTADPMMPIDCGRYLADNIDGARLVELPGDWHLSGRVGDDDDAIDAIEEFATGQPVHRDRAPDRVLATVLFTDIVDSTRQAASVGDRRWTDVLERHDDLAGHEIERHRGELVKRTGDGLLATFDGPGRAIRAATAIEKGVRGLGLDVRAGLHTGEVELRGDDVSGIGVHIAARVSALADGGEVLVSNTVKDLVIGSEIEFNDHGRHELKGVPGEWSLWAVA